MIKAQCTWAQGDGDILITFGDHRVLSYEPLGEFERYVHGTTKNGSFFLTKAEAESLVTSLLQSLMSIRHLEEELEFMHERSTGDV